MNATAQLTRDDSHQQTEGVVAKAIEKRTAQIPSDVYLWAAFGAIGAAATLRILNKKEEALFVGEWVAPFLLLGVYNKIVKVAGSDQQDRGSQNRT